MTPTAHGLQMFRDIWDTLSLLWVMGGVAFLTGVMTTFLARMEDAARLFEPRRSSFAFDWYRSMALLGFWWFTVAAVTMVEPYIWIFVEVTPNGTLLASSAWTMLALGVSSSLACFALFRLQELMGVHVWQRDAPGVLAST